MFVCGGWMPLLTCLQRYCDPASLVCIINYGATYEAVFKLPFYVIREALYLAVLFLVALNDHSQAFANVVFLPYMFKCLYALS